MSDNEIALLVRQDVEASEKLAWQLADKYIAVEVIPETFSFERMYIMQRLHILVLGQPNHFLKRYIRRTFQRRVNEHVGK